MSELNAGGVIVADEQCTNGRLDFMVRQLEDKNSIINGISDALMVLDPKTYELPLFIERTNLKELFKTLKQDFSNQFNSRQIDWREPEYSPEINADRLSVLRAVRNLVDNALKYGGEKLSKIEIGYQDPGDYHILSVKDDGIGLREEEHEKLFAAFVRKETSRGIAGAGIGLAIVKEIAEKHKGKVWLESNRDNGTVFYISILKTLRSS